MNGRVHSEMEESIVKQAWWRPQYSTFPEQIATSVMKFCTFLLSSWQEKSSVAIRKQNAELWETWIEPENKKKQ